MDNGEKERRGYHHYDLVHCHALHHVLRGCVSTQCAREHINYFNSYRYRYRGGRGGGNFRDKWCSQFPIFFVGLIAVVDVVVGGVIEGGGCVGGGVGCVRGKMFSFFSRGTGSGGCGGCCGGCGSGF